MATGATTASSSPSLVSAATGGKHMPPATGGETLSATTGGIHTSSGERNTPTRVGVEMAEPTRSFSTDTTTTSARTEEASSDFLCPALALDTVGVSLYRDFRRRYGLQRTAEERVAGLLGAVLENGPASAVLRLFARMVGAPANAAGGGEWWHPMLLLAVLVSWQTISRVYPLKNGK